jgi:hypothetical protein
VSALIGAVVADAASLPLEWIYKPETMKVQFTKRYIMVFTTDRKSFAKKRKKCSVMVNVMLLTAPVVERKLYKSKYQCCGSVTFWYESGSAPLTNGSNPTPDFFAYYSMILSFSCYFCLIIEGSGSGFLPRSNTSGSGSRRPKTHTDPDPQHC